MGSVYANIADVCVCVYIYGRMSQTVCGRANPTPSTDEPPIPLLLVFGTEERKATEFACLGQDTGGQL